MIVSDFSTKVTIQQAADAIDGLIERAKEVWRLKSRSNRFEMSGCSEAGAILGRFHVTSKEAGIYVIKNLETEETLVFSSSIPHDRAIEVLDLKSGVDYKHVRKVIAIWSYVGGKSYFDPEVAKRVIGRVVKVEARSAFVCKFNEWNHTETKEVTRREQFRRNFGWNQALEDQYFRTQELDPDEIVQEEVDFLHFHLKESMPIRNPLMVDGAQLSVRSGTLSIGHHVYARRFHVVPALEKGDTLDYESYESWHYQNTTRQLTDNDTRELFESKIGTPNFSMKTFIQKKETIYNNPSLSVDQKRAQFLKLLEKEKQSSQ